MLLAGEIFVIRYEGKMSMPTETIATTMLISNQ